MNSQDRTSESIDYESIAFVWSHASSLFICYNKAILNIDNCFF